MIFNLKQQNIKNYLRGDGGQVVMADGSTGCEPEEEG